jgi:ATP-dependent RNA helicase RhlE
MQEIERFTKQRIPVQVIEGFAPEPGERAEPIAMGRQTIWGGAGKPPSRDVMAAAAKAARQEMMQRIRDNKAADGERGSRGGNGGARNGNGGGRNGNGNAARSGSGRNGASQPQGQRAQPNGQRAQQQPRPPRNTQQHRAEQPAQMQDRDDRDEDRMPRNIDPLRTNMPGRRDMTGVQRVNVGGQPDPTRTSIDSMGAGRRGGNRNRGGGGGNSARAPSRYAR